MERNADALGGGKTDSEIMEKYGTYLQSVEPSASENSMVIILDLTPMAWIKGVYPIRSDKEYKLSLHNMYHILIKLLKAYAYMSIQNRCCIIGTHNAGCKILYEGLVFNNWLPSCYKGEELQDKHAESIVRRIWDEMIEFIHSGLDCPPTDAQLTAAISIGLLYLNRIESTKVGIGRKIIIFDVSNLDTYKSQYIGLMNVAFAASKYKITINTCAFGQSSRILEQLSDITNAKYLLLSSIFQTETEVSNFDQSIFQLLIFWLLPSQRISNLLSSQLPFEFSNTVVCYCHFRTVEISFLCPCCFAVYCSEKDDTGKYRIFCFICNSRLTKKLSKQKLAIDVDFSNF